MHIAFALDDYFRIPTVVAVHSLLRKWPTDRPVELIFLTRRLSEESKRCLTRLIQFFSCPHKIRFIDSGTRIDGLRSVQHLTPTTYARLVLAELVPEVDTILYLDGDILVTADLSNLPRVEDHLALACIDLPERTISSECGIPYCSKDPDVNPGLPIRNAGVLVLNARRWRESCFSERLLRFVDRYAGQLVLADQDAINAICGNEIGDLPPAWNRQARGPDESFTDAKIIHYTGSHKPWNSGITHPIVRLWLEEAKLALPRAGVSYRWWATKRLVKATGSALVARGRQFVGR